MHRFLRFPIAIIMVKSLKENIREDIWKVNNMSTDNSKRIEHVI